MLVQFALLVLNVSLVGFIVYAIVRPKTTKRQVREVIEQACQRWKSGRPVRGKTPNDCVVCCSQAEECRPLARLVATEPLFVLSKNGNVRRQPGRLSASF